MCATGKRGNESDQCRPGHDLVHLVEEDFLAGLLGQGVQAQGVLIHSDIVLDAWRRGRSGGGGFADLP